ncbi:MAG TPA: TetR/AcrR family transcriptional regulator [Casimicrobiaceae bacterium]|nr:TetR/AcrR family transcriptional regulator [Casimicrobiaceae bacterium]
MPPAPRTPGTRARLLAAAVTLLRRSGLSGAGINEIVRESGAPKGSVYHYFPQGKQQIATEALALHGSAVTAFIDAAMAGGRSGPRKVEALFRAFAKRAEEGGFDATCPAGTVCLDLDAGLEALRRPVADAFDCYVDAIARHVDCGTPARTRSFASLLLTAIEGAYLRCRAERSSRAFHEAGRWLAPLAAPVGTPRPGASTAGSRR